MSGLTPATRSEALSIIALVDSLGYYLTVTLDHGRRLLLSCRRDTLVEQERLVGIFGPSFCFI